MVKPALLLVCTLLCGCDRGFDDVPPAPALPEEGGEYLISTLAELQLYHNPQRFNGNDVYGEPFPLTICPDPEVVVGLSIATNDAGVPSAMSLRCAKVDSHATVGATRVGPRIGAEPSADTPEQLIDCPAGWIGVSLRGGELYDLSGEDRPPFVVKIGLECAEPESWLRGLAIATYTAQAGVNAPGTAEFVQGCTEHFGILKGFSGRISDRLEQVSHACVGATYRVQAR